MATKTTRPKALLTLAAATIGFVSSLGLALKPGVAFAQDWDLGLRTGLYTDQEEVFVGVEGVTRIADTRFFFNPNAEAVFVENGDLFTLSLDVHYDLDLDLDHTDIWLGAGPTLVIRDPERGRGDDDFGLNVLAGIGLREGGVRPYGQVKLILADDVEVVLGVGIRFF